MKPQRCITRSKYKVTQLLIANNSVDSIEPTIVSEFRRAGKSCNLERIVFSKSVRSLADGFCTLLLLSLVTVQLCAHGRQAKIGQ